MTAFYSFSMRSQVMTESDGEGDYRGLVLARNRKQRKAGGWQALGLDHAVFKAIEKKGYRQPTPIQRKAIPLIVDGKDVVAMSRTGSGKTAAFVVPMLQKLKRREVNGTRALLIAPTRELALQTFKFTKELGRFTGLRCAALVGGDSIEEQFGAIHEKPDIIIATPGRLLHLIIEMNLRLTTVQYLVFDEADRLFEMGFSEQLHEILKRLPDNRQTLLFSATLPKMLVDFAKAGLTDPVLVRLDVDEKISDRLSMIFLTCRTADKISAFLYLVRLAIANNEMTIVFCATMKHVEYLAAVAQRAAIDCVVLYSQLDAAARKINIERFRSKQCLLLIVTDVAARGVDIPLLDNAINFHFPPKAKLFVHRVGRVARAGKSGKSYSLISADELPYLADLFLFLGRPLNFAKPDSIYREDEPLVGVFTDDLVELESDFLRAIHDNCEEMADLRKKSENAMSKYSRTRPQPSAESVRRTKTELREAFAAASPHPILRRDAAPVEDARMNFLQELHSFKPHTTIFEVQSGNKSQPAAIMKKKRKAHQKFVKEHVSVHLNVDSCPTSDDCSANKNTLNDAVQNTFHEVIRSSKFVSQKDDSLKRRKRSQSRKADELERERRNHFIAYAPADAASERALAVDRGFDAEARANAVDICADDITEMYKQQKRKKWDRKRKRFVGESGEDAAKKKIRTEDGSSIPASYKSGRYEKWYSKQKIRYRDNEIGGEEAGEEHSVQQSGSSHRRRKRGGIPREKGIQGGRSELRNPEQILKIRRKKDSIRAYQAHRREQNLKKKGALAGERRIVRRR